MPENLSSAEGPYFGEYGGRFVPEPLIEALDQLDSVYQAARKDPTFQAELDHLHKLSDSPMSLVIYESF